MPQLRNSRTCCINQPFWKRINGVFIEDCLLWRHRWFFFRLSILYQIARWLSSRDFIFFVLVQLWNYYLFFRLMRVPVQYMLIWKKENWSSSKLLALMNYRHICELQTCLWNSGFKLLLPIHRLRSSARMWRLQLQVIIKWNRF